MIIPHTHLENLLKNFTRKENYSKNKAILCNYQSRLFLMPFMERWGKSKIEKLAICLIL
jgi:hypothetical protein